MPDKKDAVRVQVDQLKVGMILAGDLADPHGTIVASAYTEITKPLIMQIFLSGVRNVFVFSASAARAETDRFITTDINKRQSEMTEIMSSVINKDQRREPYMSNGKDAIRVQTEQLKVGMILAGDVVDLHGTVVARAYSEITTPLIRRIFLGGARNVFVFSASAARAETDRIITADINKRQAELTETMSSIIKTKEIDQQSIFELTADAIKLANTSRKDGGVDRYLALLRKKNEYTYTHCMSVSILANQFAQWLDMSEDEIFDMTVAGSLHDIGKLYIDSGLITKQGPLTDEEYMEMKKHVVYSSELLSACSAPERVIMAVSEHHERLDGKGYPKQKKDGEISIYGNVLAITDCYDAFVSKRSYRAAMCPFYAMDVLNEGKFSTYDFKLVEVFIQHTSFAFVGAQVELSNGLFGNVVHVNPNNFLRPFVKTQDEGIINLEKESKIKIVRVI